MRPLSKISLALGLIVLACAPVLAANPAVLVAPPARGVSPEKLTFFAINAHQVQDEKTAGAGISDGEALHSLSKKSQMMLAPQKMGRHLDMSREIQRWA